MAIYKKFGSNMRMAGLLAGFLALAACDGGDKAGDSADGKQMDGLPRAADSQVAVDPAVSQTGTWGDIVYGSADAPVEVIEYASLTCPHCAAFYKAVFPEIEKDYIESGKVRFVYRNYILNQLDLAASAVARCGDMESTKKMMQIYFARQREWAGSEKPIDELAALARRVGISRTEFDRCLSDTNMHKHLVELTQNAQKVYDVQGTPTLFVNGKRVDSNGLDALKEAIDGAL
ncbi:MAG: DsbA family protein [Alphaproteobacteria bacterium]|nr:MAG: DsbA family protein [Alphaproteobacteria bacterium]